jgi:hypothetical protein
MGGLFRSLLRSNLKYPPTSVGGIFWFFAKQFFALEMKIAHGLSGGSLVMKRSALRCPRAITS